MNWIGKLFKGSKVETTLASADSEKSKHILARILEASQKEPTVVFFSSERDAAHRLAGETLRAACLEGGLVMMWVDAGEGRELVSKYAVAELPMAVSVFKSVPTDRAVMTTSQDDARAFVRNAKSRAEGKPVAVTHQEASVSVSTKVTQASTNGAGELTGADINRISGAIDAFAKERGHVQPKFRVEHAGKYWEFFTEMYLPRTMRDYNEGDPRQKEFVKLLFDCLEVRGVRGEVRGAGIEQISVYHRIVLLNAYDALTDGQFFANTAAMISGRPTPTKPTIDYDGIAFQMLELVGAPDGVEAWGESCNKMAHKIVSTLLEHILEDAKNARTPMVLYHAVGLDLIAKSAFTSWSKGELGVHPFFLIESEMNEWREHPEFKHFELEYLSDGTKVVLVVPDTTSVDLKGVKCRLVMMHPRFPDEFVSSTKGRNTPVTDAPSG
jgi:hypothetical protein